MKKRTEKYLIVSVVIILMLICTNIIAMAQNEYDNELRLMKNLEIMQGYDDGTMRGEDPINRMEFVTVALRTLGYYDAVGYQAENKSYEDVEPALWAEGNIYFARDLGLVNGYSDSKFAPYDNVTANQAIKIMVCALGYELKNGESIYPDTYLKTGLELGLTKGIRTGEVAITRGEIACLIANALDTYVVDMTYSGNKVIYNQGEKTLLNLMGLEKIKATPTGAYGISIGDLPVNESDLATIDGEIYRLKCGDISDCVGKETNMYVRYGGSGAYPEIYYVQKTANNESDTFYSHEITDNTTLSTLKIYRDSKMSTINLGTEIPIVYNGKLLSTSQTKPDVLRPRTGYITVAGRNSDNRYVFVWNFENLVVRAVTEDKIYDIFGKKVDLSDDDTCYRIVHNGEFIKISDICAGDILSVAASLDGEFIYIIVNRENFEGMLSAVSYGEDETIFEIEGENSVEKYLAENYLKLYNDAYEIKLVKLYPGDKAVFYTDIFGDIAYTEPIGEIDAYRYGYLTEAYLKNSLKDTLQLKILSEENTFEIYEVTKKLRVLYGIESMGTYKQSVQFFEAFCKKVIDDGETVRQPVKYRYDGNGELKEIYLMPEYAVSDKWGGYEATNTYACYNGTIDGRILFDAKTVAFIIPDAGADPELYEAGKAISLLSSGSKTVRLYDIREGRAGLIIINSHIISDNGYEYMIDMVNNPIMLIENVSSERGDDGEFYKTLTGWQDGEIVSVRVADKLEPNSDPEKELRKGMLIQYLLNKQERKRAETSDEDEHIILYRKIEDLNSIPYAYQKWNYSGVENNNAKIRIISGTVQSYSVPNMIINCGTDAAVSVDEGVNVIIWDRDTSSGRKGSIYDVMLNEPVIVRTRYNKTRDIFIFK